MVWEEPLTEDQITSRVNEMFSTLDDNKNGTLEIDELLHGYKSFPWITQCFSKLKESVAVTIVQGTDQPKTLLTDDRSACARNCASCSLQ